MMESKCSGAAFIPDGMKKVRPGGNEVLLGKVSAKREKPTAMFVGVEVKL